MPKPRGDVEISWDMHKPRGDVEISWDLNITTRFMHIIYITIIARKLSKPDDGGQGRNM